MKKILFACLIILLGSCKTRPPKNNLFVFVTNDGLFYATEYMEMEGHYDINACFAIPKEYVLDIRTTERNYNELYYLGYRQGQIDALEGRPRFIKVTNNDGEVVYTDTSDIQNPIKIIY